MNDKELEEFMYWLTKIKCCYALPGGDNEHYMQTLIFSYNQWKKNRPEIKSKALQHLLEAQKCLESIGADDWAEDIEETRNAIQREWEEQDDEN